MMVPLPPEGKQRLLTSWSKYLLTFYLMALVIIPTVAGFQLGLHITVLGIFLNSRAVLQYIFANLNNWRMRKATGRVIVDAVIAYRQRQSQTLPQYASYALNEEDIQYLNKQVGKKLTLTEFTKRIENRLHIKRKNRKTFWSAVANESVLVLDAVTNKHGKKKYQVNQVIDANIPIYQVVIPELTQVLKKAKDQILPFNRFWLVLNDPLNEPVRVFLHEWVAEQQREVWAAYEAALGTAQQMTEHYRDFLLNRWVIIDLSEADKRSAMTVAWLASFGVAIEQLEDFVRILFNEPGRQLALKPPECQINLNIDSDTIASPFASWITYISFVVFDLAGLTSNVRISNITDGLDPEMKKWPAFVKWFISWSNYYKYDYANNVERAAQSWFWCVVCMSGPWMALKTSAIPKFLGRFVNYTYGGVRIKPGDDRKVTYELNWMKMRTAYHPWVVVFTDAPDSIKRYCQIQTRWTLSMYANVFTSVLEGQIWSLHPWVIVDQLYAAGFTFLVMGVFARLALTCLGVLITSGLPAVGAVLLPYVLVFAIVNLVRGLYAVWDNDGDLRGMLNAFYFILVGRYLIPIKLTVLFITGVPPKVQVPWQGRPDPKAA